jgi:hypothetical protein
MWSDQKKTPSAIAVFVPPPRNHRQPLSDCGTVDRWNEPHVYARRQLAPEPSFRRSADDFETVRQRFFAESEFRLKRLAKPDHRGLPHKVAHADAHDRRRRFDVRRGAHVQGRRSRPDCSIVIRTQACVRQRLVGLRQFRRADSRNVLELMPEVLHFVGVIFRYFATKRSPDFVDGRSGIDPQQIVMSRDHLQPQPSTLEADAGSSGTDALVASSALASDPDEAAGFAQYGQKLHSG